MIKTDLSVRLATVASLVRSGGFLADIGTDHAKLPIALITSGRVRGAVATDLGTGPITRAKENIARAGCSGKIVVLQTNGLIGVEKYNPTEITICGMGGELIRDIISAALWLKDSAIRLILQPQSFAPVLREYLLGAGYNIAEERLCRDGGKYYVCIAAEYDGIVRQYTPAELYLGRENLLHGGECFAGYARFIAEVIKKRRDGMEVSGADTEKDDALLGEIRTYI